MKTETAQTGFTLIEMLMAVTILAILAAVAIPRFSQTIKLYRLNNAVSDLHSKFAYFRSEAIRQNKSVAMTFTRTSATQWCYGATATASSCNCSAATSTCEIATVKSTDYSNVSLDIASGANTTVSFEPVRGLLTGTLNTILYNGTQKLTITATALGRLSTCSSGSQSVSGYSAC